MSMKKFFYRVSDGDSVFSVAERFNMPLSALVEINNLSCEIQAGDMLYVECLPCELYKVQPTDDVHSVAKKFCVKEEDILKINGVPYLFYGLKIKLPEQ